MRNFNQELLSKIFDICERNNSTSDVGPWLYECFLNATEKEMNSIVVHIVVDRAESINKIIELKKWKTDEDMYDYMTTLVELMVLGIMKIREDDGHLVFVKPIGDPPDEEMERKLDAKINSFRPIIAKVLMEASSRRQQNINI